MTKKRKKSDQQASRNLSEQLGIDKEGTSSAPDPEARVMGGMIDNWLHTNWLPLHERPTHDPSKEVRCRVEY